MEFLGGVLTGLVVAILVQFVVGVYIQPALKLREAIWSVDHSLIQYANVYNKSAPEALKGEAQSRFRNHASELSAKSRTLLGYRVWVRLKLLPMRANVLAASSKLIYLSNLAITTHSDNPAMNAVKAEDEIRTLLNIKTTQEG
jgi:hypothetical protein